MQENVAVLCSQALVAATSPDENLENIKEDEWVFLDGKVLRSIVY